MSATEITKELARQWKELDEDEQNEWKEATVQTRNDEDCRLEVCFNKTTQQCGFKSYLTDSSQVTVSEPLFTK